MRARLTLAAAALLCLAVASPASAWVGPFNGVAVGGQDRVRVTDDGTDEVTNQSSYRGRFLYSFRIDGYGNISGIGHGAYESATWHLEGTNNGESFSCDPPVATSGFTVEISGTARNGVMNIRFRIVDAVETNDDYDCGAGYTGYATTSYYLAESLDEVQPSAGLDVSQTAPRIGRLAETRTETFTGGSRTVDSFWDITIVPPPGPQPLGGGPNPGTASGPNDPRAAICTINGTSGRNVLRGTPGNDVICGFGGNDVIKGLGGNDILIGGPGNDVLTGGPGSDSLYGNAGRDVLLARDGAKDIVSGGPARDRGRVDRGRDRVQSIEVVLG